MVIRCFDCKKSVATYKPDRLSFCPFCGSENIICDKGKDTKKYVENAIPRMRELADAINEYHEKLVVARKEYRTLYNTIKVYQRRGLVPADADIPLVADGRKNKVEFE